MRSPWYSARTVVFSIIEVAAVALPLPLATMLLRHRIIIDRETVVAIGILWAVALVCALTLGQEPLLAAANSLVGALSLSLSYLIADNEGRGLVAKLAGALGFFAVGMLVAMLSFAGDCLFGSLISPGIPLLTACVEKSGIGFAFTVLCVVMAVGMPLVGLLRSAVAAVWRRGG